MLISFKIHYNNIPFGGKSDLQILSLVSRGVRPPRLDEQPLSDRAWDVIQRFWVREPLKRPRMNNVVESMIAMSPSLSAQINADGESLWEELPSSSTPDSKVRRLAFSTNRISITNISHTPHQAYQKRKRVHVVSISYHLSCVTFWARSL